MAEIVYIFAKVVRLRNAGFVGDSFGDEGDLASLSQHEKETGNRVGPRWESGEEGRLVRGERRS